MTTYVYFTATSLDGFIADQDDSLAWLDGQEHDPAGPGGYDVFIRGIGAAVCGATTYAWVSEELARTGEPWPYDFPFFVFTHRELEPLGPQVRLVSGSPAAQRSALESAAGDRDVWVVGGGDLAGQLAEAGMLDLVQVSIAPVTLGSGRPLLPRRWRLELRAAERNGDLLMATFTVVGALG